MAKSYYSNSVFVPNQGWFIFGGAGNSLKNSQKLPTISSSWEVGPYLYQGRPVSQQCSLQVIYVSSFPFMLNNQNDFILTNILLQNSGYSDVQKRNI
jgi:hypothetical protein